MLKQLKQYNKLNETLFLFFLSVVSFSFSIFRYVLTNSITFWFLNWNLFLAAIPWVLSTLMIIKPKLQQKKIILVFLLGFWLLFFPNAPYILTDLFHLRLNLGMPIWFDLILILTFAWTGLMFGLISLMDIEKILRKFINKYFVYLITSSLLFIGSFGIYIGRYLRWNSWDIIQKPFELIYDIGDRFINPFNHPRTWGMTIFLGIFLNIVYWSLKVLSSKSKNNLSK